MSLKKPNKSSSLKYILEYAKAELGLDLPADIDKDDALIEVRKVLQEMGDKPAPDDDDDAEEGANDAGGLDGEENTQAPAAKTDKPSHYTIRVTRPSDTKLPDMVVNANGDNFQIHFGKNVKVPAVVFNILSDAKRFIPAYRDMETNELVPENWEHEVNFSVVQEHFN